MKHNKTCVSLHAGVVCPLPPVVYPIQRFVIQLMVLGILDEHK